MWLEGGATTGTRAPDWLEGASTDECQIAQAAINLMRSKNSVLIDILQTLLREYRKKNNNGEHRLKRAQ